MSTGVLVGVSTTAISLAVFLLWSYRELKRIDQYAPEGEDERSGGHER